MHMLTRAITRGMNFVRAADPADSDNTTKEEMAGIGKAQVYETADLSDSDGSIDDRAGRRIEDCILEIES